MSHIINARNVNDALAKGLLYLKMNGDQATSRNGPVIVAPGPVITEYAKPWERVLFSPLRDANPFFHLMEAIWMMAGNNDLAWPQRFNSKFGAYSDDGRTLRGAYGFRWRKFFAMDQLLVIRELLREDPTTRRAVLNMWSPGADLGANSADIPCNTQCYFDTRGGALNMTICCRSNDLLWGAYGANAVHFSVLQEWMACATDLPCGIMRQLSNNYHLYTEVLPIRGLPGQKDATSVAEDAATHNHYVLDGLGSHPLVVRDPLLWLGEAELFLKQRVGIRYTEPFFETVAKPMLFSWAAYEKRDWPSALLHADMIQGDDWEKACSDWLRRRHRNAVK